MAVLSMLTSSPCRPRPEWALDQSQGRSLVIGLSPDSLSVPLALAGLRREIDDVVTAAVRVAQGLRYSVLVLSATAAQTQVVRDPRCLPKLCRLGHQLGYGSAIPKPVRGPG